VRKVIQPSTTPLQPMTSISPIIPKVATLTLPTREAYVSASVWPGAGGILLLVAELNLSPQARQELTNALISKLEHRWTELARTGKELPADGVLEQSLIEANSILKLHERLLGNPLAPRYHIAIAFLRGTDLAAAAVGHCGVFVVNEDGFTSITQPDGASRRPAKPTFEQIVSGRLAVGETLLVTTPALMDYFSMDKLQQLVLGHPPGFSLREIEKFMLSLKVHPPLGIISLRPELTDAATQDTDSSIRHLMDTRAATSLLLKPSVWQYLRTKLSRGTGSPANQSLPVEVREQNTDIVQAAPHLKHPQEGPSLLARVNRHVARIKWLTDRELAKTTISRWLEQRYVTWQRLSPVKRITLTLALIALVAFCQSIVNLGKRNLEERLSEHYNGLITQITERQAAAESALIYQDDSRARTLLDDAYGLLATLPQGTKQREQQRHTLSQSLDLTRQR
jgi:hypothetical protein